MRATILLLVFVAAYCSTDGQTASKQAARSAVPVYVTHAGQDATRVQFVDAVKRALSQSDKYKLANPNDSAHERGFRLYLDIATLDVASTTAEHPSVASVVIEEMGLFNSWPVPFMWYHKTFLVKANRLDELAQQFVADMDAHWCNHIKSSIGNCPKESISPVYP
jgi:hypothetical protein